MRIVRPFARLVIGLELLNVAKDLDEALLLRHTHVPAQVAAEPVAKRSPGEPAAVLREVVEGDSELAPVDELEREVVQVRVALVDEGEGVVIGVDVQPDARAAEAVGDAHPEYLRVEGRLLLELRGQEVRVPELARAKARELSGRAADVRPWIVGRPVRNELDAVVLGIPEIEAHALGLEVNSRPLEVRGRLLEGKPADELPRVVIEARDVVLDELERVRLIATAQEGTAILSPTPGEAELDAPAR